MGPLAKVRRLGGRNFFLGRGTDSNLPAENLQMRTSHRMAQERTPSCAWAEPTKHRGHQGTTPLPICTRTAKVGGQYLPHRKQVNAVVRSVIGFHFA